ncbi:thiol-specific monooxygenase [Niveomyces insectorum RCEF 264]|uniref:Thiol-specific monooxygenase n=1 Tax=Niveomyces insectorum RCEF 264 TaxID=1081102 RepID=A0A162IF98_9HYPO|nr:thiol-specific monooxygenase [Niveomyces insectorum RCEF 264]
MPAAEPRDGLMIDRVAVIGAGPCGLAAAKYLAAENKFAKIDVFEQRATPGGLWNYTATNAPDTDFAIPRTLPTTRNDVPVRTDGSVAAQFVSPVYDALETNIPYTLMNYSDLPFPDDTPLFPHHTAVNAYLHVYAKDVQPFLHLETQVVSAKKIKLSGASGPPCPKAVWELKLLDLRNQIQRTVQYDAVLVASGHYNDPFVPDIAGLAAFDRAHPGVVIHSKFYRRPDDFTAMKVVVVGNSASGIDISAQVATVAQSPVFVSEKEAAAPPADVQALENWACLKPEIVQFLPESRAVCFADGSVVGDIDAVIFCTGYLYSFPFLRNTDTEKDDNTAIITDGAYAHHLYQHILYIEDPSLAFLGIPQRIVPMPVAEAQSAWVARLWANRLPMPTMAEMRAWEMQTLQEKGASKLVHNLAFPRDVIYINWLHDRSLEAVPRLERGLANGGAGKIPPYWGEEKAWVRQRFPLIKAANRALGDKRNEVRTLEQLGFDFHAWKATKAAEEKEAADGKNPETALL